ncbi:MAG: RnfH family protein [Nitrosomonas sp.]|nr:RnfH family protein [Nitrosomonas sp.]
MAHQPEQPIGIPIEVVCAVPRHQFLKKLEVVSGTTIAQAIALSGVEAFLSKNGCATQLAGIYGRQVGPQTILQAHDRVEIYRPLAMDPKEKRRLRSARKV